jgi:hypothetical protein
MTTLVNKTVSCPACGASNKIALILSAYMYGASDLDLRPPMPLRATLSHEIHQCTTCAFCAPGLDYSVAAVDVVRTLAYRAIILDRSLPIITRQFSAFAFMCEQDGHWDGAGWAMLRAAWACDDVSGSEMQARQSRHAVLRYIGLIHANGQTFSEDRVTDALLELDLLRRCGELDGVRVRSSALCKENLPSALRAVAEFHSHLADQGDIACHTIDEATASSDRLITVPSC